ncbi:RDD family protein [Bacillus sp. EB01]|uniref:RDD family protein n=1 Tax=Bacillus sp. EB01 TaxID=1347086 RepID=UPI000694BA8B|nr:RDD family protein [Bacillus sp. EB01]
MHCPNCHTKNDESERLCSNCGEYLGGNIREVCPDCETEREEGESYCQTCGYHFKAHSVVRPYPNHMEGREGFTYTSEPNYGNQGYTLFAPEHVRFANFGERVVASLIDYVVTYIVGYLIGYLVGFLFVSVQSQNFYTLLGLIIGLAYKAGMESSAKQATLGKLAMGLKVINKSGERISFARATGRYFANYLNVFPTFFVGFLMVLWTKEKRALHDFVAGTLVVKTK